MSEHTMPARVLYQILGGAVREREQVAAAVPAQALSPDTPGPQAHEGVITDQPQALWRPGAKLFIVEQGESEVQSDSMKTRIKKAMSAAQLAQHNIFTRGEHTISTGVVAVSGSAVLNASGDVIVYASGAAKVFARGEGVKIFACDNVTGKCWDRVELELGGHAIFHTYDKCHATATEHAHVIGHNRTRTDATGDARVDLYDFATGDGKERSFFRGYNKSRIRTTDLANVLTFDQSKALLDGQTTGIADGQSQMFAGPSARVRRLGFAQVRPLQADFFNDF